MFKTYQLLIASLNPFSKQQLLELQLNIKLSMNGCMWLIAI